jgi:hypothetical protein
MYVESLILGIANICDLLRVSKNQLQCATGIEQWQQWRQQRQQQRSGTTIPLAQQGCVTGVVFVIIIVSVMVSAYVAAAVPGHVVAVAAVVAGAAPSAALIVVLPIVGTDLRDHKCNRPNVVGKDEDYCCRRCVNIL